MIRDITESNLQRARAFLERHVETSLFLLSNLAQLGPHLGEHLNSGNFRCLEENGAIAAVFCLTRRGNLLAQTGGRSDFAREILRACGGEPIRIEGVLAEWRAAESLWRLLCEQPHFQSEHESREILYRLDLTDRDPPRPGADCVRALAPGDFDQWEQLNTAYLFEEGLPVQGTAEQRTAGFVSGAAAGHWWGVFEGPCLVAIAGLNAAYGSTGQVGGVYTPPERRRRGLARSAMGGLLRDSIAHHRLAKLILFTGQNNIAAQGLYRSLGFASIGEFGLLFGSWRGET